MRRTPLLEFDDDEGRLPGARVLTCKHDVDPLAAQRQGMLDDHLDPAEASLDEIVREDGQASFPTALFGLGRAASLSVAHLLGDPNPQRAFECERGKSSS